MATPKTKISVTAAVRRFERRGIVVSYSTVRRMCARLQLDAVRVSGRWKVDPASVDNAAKRKK